MSDNEGPKAPFAYRPDEPFVGEGALLRTRRRRLVTGVVALAVVLVAVGLLQLQRFNWAQDLDPTINTRTGLADGAYAIEVRRSYRADGECWFEGSVRGMPTAAEVRVYGTGIAQCAASGDYVGHVYVTVSSGEATITRVKGY